MQSMNVSPFSTPPHKSVDSHSFTHFKTAGETIGLLHWKSLGDSLTWVNGTDRFSERMPYDYQAFFDALNNVYIHFDRIEA